MKYTCELLFPTVLIVIGVTVGDINFNVPLHK